MWLRVAKWVSTRWTEERRGRRPARAHRRGVLAPAAGSAADRREVETRTSAFPPLMEWYISPVEVASTRESCVREAGYADAATRTPLMMQNEEGRDTRLSNRT